MDQDTRNKLQRATQQVRRILEEEFAEQLEGTFDVLPNGEILSEPGRHLDALQRLSRKKLVDAIEHIKAGGKTPQEAVDEYTREAAFTFLNRFVALRMLEARGLLQECVSKGDASSGFKEFAGLAPGLSSLEDGGYRLYLECLFDELSVEVKVLFDRRDQASLLWPRRGALTELLGILGDADLSGVWSEDEAIGWVYQYFNSGEERKKMRDESQAPRNSRELAVRNQFFTPRYVVEFLTDNTLGRIWYEMRQGQTRLVDECQYLVRRPSEVFMDKGQEPPADENEAVQDLSQEELLQKTAYIPHRAQKDPRDLKVLDPACGSGHFLLYAFDLLVSIYEEAWHGEASESSEGTGHRLRDDYTELKQLHAALPGLVLAHNLHGIDIDPRAAQIAALALWMRGQRAFNEFGVTRQQRPAISRSNIVCAEPMPGEAAFLEEFIAEQLSGDAEGRFLASLVRKVFEAMKMAGEAGSLLKIEQDIAEEVAKAKKQWLERPGYRQQTLFEDGPKAVQKELDLTIGITDKSFWEEAEQRIYEALRDYSEQADRSGGFQRRLFAADAARGFSFIDLCRSRYDVALMNPPFGEFIESRFSMLKSAYPRSKRDLAAAFVDRAIELHKANGLIGALFSRRAFYLDTQKHWRSNILKDHRLFPVADLGHRVLDSALVEVVATVFRNDRGESMFLSCLSAEDKSAHLTRILNDGCINKDVYIRDTEDFRALPTAQIAYFVPDCLLHMFRNAARMSDASIVRAGLQSSDNFRFIRLSWECPQSANEGLWVRMAKGGVYQQYYLDHELLVKWDGGYREMASYNLSVGNEAQSRRASDHYFVPGLTYTERTASRLSVRVLPKGTIFNVAGPACIPLPGSNIYAVLGITNCLLYAALVEVSLGSGDSVNSGSAARHYTSGIMEAVPFPSNAALDEIPVAAVQELIRLHALIRSELETSPLFAGLVSSSLFDVTFADYVAKRLQSYEERVARIIDLSWEVERAAVRAYGHDETVLDEIEFLVGRHPGQFPSQNDPDLELFEKYYSLSEDKLVDEVANDLGSPRYITVQSFVVDRRLELSNSRHPLPF